MALTLKKPIAKLHPKEQHISVREHLTSKRRTGKGKNTCRVRARH